MTLEKAFTFKPGSFTDISDRPESQKLWSFLSRLDNRIRMQTASDLGRPALEAVSSRILKEFEEVFSDTYPHLARFKQMAGAMTRQVMEADGYAFLRDNVPLSGSPFARAAKYHDPERVKVYVWQCSNDPRHIGLTTSIEDADKLPVLPDATWCSWRNLMVCLHTSDQTLRVSAGIQNMEAATTALRETGAYSERTTRMMRAPRQTPSAD